MQTTTMYSKSMNKDGTRIVLKDRGCDDGSIGLHFMVLSKGVFSIMFRYIDEKTYYAI
jgi:hypothetical protein